MIKIRYKNPVFWEVTTWAIIIVATGLTLLVFPWYLAQQILNYLFVSMSLVGIFWYARSRRLYDESQEKTKKILDDQRRIRASEKTLNLIYENSADGILILDNDQRITGFSPGMEKITGFSKDEVLGHKAQQVLKFQSARNDSLLPDLIFLPKDVTKRSYIRNILTTKDGREIDIEASYTIIEQNNEHTAMAVIRDMTYENELQERDKDFVAITSHQMNTPLSIIRGYVSLLRKGKTGEINDEQKKYLDEIYAATCKLIGMTDNLLSISRIEQEKIKIVKSDVNVADMFKKMSEDLDIYRKEGSSVELKIEEPPVNLIISADENKLSQSLLNLINNSLKYTKEGFVSLSVKETDNEVIFAVEDSGIGITDEDLGKIGQKFYRAQNAIDIDNKGTGLGLFITKTIAEKHGGKLDIKSKLGQGTTISVVIPK
jgi:PAS domain S-box-containing protein